MQGEHVVAAYNQAGLGHVSTVENSAQVYELLECLFVHGGGADGNFVGILHWKNGCIAWDQMIKTPRLVYAGRF